MLLLPEKQACTTFPCMQMGQEGAYLYSTDTMGLACPWQTMGALLCKAMLPLVGWTPFWPCLPRLEAVSLDNLSDWEEPGSPD